MGVGIGLDIRSLHFGEEKIEIKNERGGKRGS